MSPRRKTTDPELKAWMRHCANSSRDTADEMARQYGGCDDPMHPYSMFDENGDQRFRDWVDFTDRVARVVVDSENEEAVQAAMALYRTESPFYLCVSLVMAANRIKELEDRLADHDSAGH